MKYLSFLRNKYMRFLFHAFWNLHRFVVSNNKKFKNKHTNEKCLIFGNGGSLKLLDFKAIQPHYLKIGCTYNLIDKRFINTNKLDYCIFSYPYGLFPIVWAINHQSFIWNVIGKIHKKIIKQNDDVTFFHSLTNYYSYFKNPKNLNFFYNFNKKKCDSFDLDHDFNYTGSALEIMIGTAKFMGVKDLFLLGCDYLGDPIGYGHFYASGNIDYSIQDEFHAGEVQLNYQKRIKKICEGLNVTVVLPKNVNCKLFDTLSIEEFLSSPEIYQENMEILRDDFVPLLREGQNKRIIYFENDYKQMWGISVEENNKIRRNKKDE